MLRNLPLLELLPAPTAVSRPFRAVYVGDVRGSRGLWTMLDAIERTDGWELDVVGPVSPVDAARLQERLGQGTLARRVRFHGRHEPRQSWALVAGAACGLVLLDDTRAFRDALPTKLYEYVASGLPVVVTDLPRQRAFVERYGIGEVIPSGPEAAPATARVLLDWAAHPERLAELAARTAVFRAEADAWAEDYRSMARSVARLAAARGADSDTQ
ncbi:glycosyltransferase [Intrasporangium chromatireducens]|uniref:glycosyltransferase n=1 Tax=Intrasporangium chromatireducens TaxID=1386088 RepID=UPI00138DE2BF|nr:glycosyltransferase [Intrasporangium chromatireducens]